MKIKKKSGIRIQQDEIVCETGILNTIHELDRLEGDCYSIKHYNIFKFAYLRREDFYGQVIPAVNTQLI